MSKFKEQEQEKSNAQEYKKKILYNFVMYVLKILLKDVYRQ